MRFVIEYWNDGAKKYIPLWEGDTYALAKTMMNTRFNIECTRRLKVVDERILCKVKAGKYMVDDEDIPGKHKPAFK